MQFFKKRTTSSLFVFVLLSFIATSGVYSQESQQVYLQQIQDSLKPLSKIILDLSQPESNRVQANEQFRRIIKRCLEQPESYQFSFDSVPAIARLVPEDQRFILYNWELPHEDGTFTYFAFVLHKGKNLKQYQLTELLDASASIKRPETAVLKPNQWFGAHYYKIVTVKRKGKSYYCLLGADWNDRLSKKKLLDVVSFEKDGSMKFGAPIINYNKVVLHRLIFEYSSKVSMSMNYDEKRKLIIFDHLSPIGEGLKGQYQFYAPDLSYDALKFKKGKWQLIENVDARNLK